jgi:hypothetical protein
VTTTRTRSSRVAGIPWEDHTVVGWPDDIVRLVASADRAGRLVYMTPPRPHRSGDGRVVLRVRLHTKAPRTLPSNRQAPAGRIRRTRRVHGPAIVAVAAAAAAVAGLAYALVELVTWLAGLVYRSGTAIVGAITAIVLVLLLLGRTAVQHCPGCRR